MKNRKYSALADPGAYFKRFLFALAASIIIFLLIDLFGGRAVQHSGIVVEKLYKPEQSRIIQKAYQDSKGRVHYRVVTETDPATWTLYVQSLSGRIIRVDAAPEVFYTSQKGQLVPYIVYQGKWTRMPYIIQATNKPTHTNEKDTETSRNQTAY
jgi:hypothetical protein